MQSSTQIKCQKFLFWKTFGINEIYKYHSIRYLRFFLENYVLKHTPNIC